MLPFLFNRLLQILSFYVIGMAPKKKVASVPEVGELSRLHIKQDESSTEGEAVEPLFDRGTLRALCLLLWSASLVFII